MTPGAGEVIGYALQTGYQPIVLAVLLAAVAYTLNEVRALNPAYYATKEEIAAAKAAKVKNAETTVEVTTEDAEVIADTVEAIEETAEEVVEKIEDAIGADEDVAEAAAEKAEELAEETAEEVEEKAE